MQSEHDSISDHKASPGPRARAIARGIRARLTPWFPVIHALAALLAGVLLSFEVQRNVVGGLFVGIPFLVVLGVKALIVTGITFAALSKAFTGKWNLRFAAVISVGFVAVQTAIVWLFPQSNGWMPGEPASIITGAAIGIVSALVMHSGVPRMVGLAAAILTIPVLGFAHLDPSDLDSSESVSPAEAEAVARFGSDVRPYVTEVVGLVSFGEPAAVSSTVVVGIYAPAGSSGEVPQTVYLATDNSGLPACGGAPFGRNVILDASDGPCEMSADHRRVRNGTTANEVVEERDGIMLRAAAANDVPIDTLHEALDEATLMDDRYYRHLLYGESVEYIPELDGAR